MPSCVLGARPGAAGETRRDARGREPRDRGPRRRLPMGRPTTRAPRTASDGKHQYAQEQEPHAHTPARPAGLSDSTVRARVLRRARAVGGGVITRAGRRVTPRAVAVLGIVRAASVAPVGRRTHRRIRHVRGCGGRLRDRGRRECRRRWWWRGRQHPPPPTAPGPGCTDTSADASSGASNDASTAP